MAWYFWGWTVDARPAPTYEEKNRVPPPPPPLGIDAGPVQSLGSFCYCKFENNCESFILRRFVKIKPSRNGEITLSFMDVNHASIAIHFYFANMSFNVLRENKIIAKISEITMTLRDHRTVKRLQRENYIWIGVSFRTVHFNEIWTVGWSLILKMSSLVQCRMGDNLKHTILFLKNISVVCGFDASNDDSFPLGKPFNT